MKKKLRRFVVWLACFLLVWPSSFDTFAKEEISGLYARGAVLMDGDSGRILFGKEADTELAMASTTKIMTCIVALEEAEEGAVCTVSDNAASQPPVKLGMARGDRFYLKDLLRSLMLESHNDSAVCIAENIGGSVEGFAEKMNAKARKIGCTRTHYVTPNGLDGEDASGSHHTTPRELALVLRYCLNDSPKAEEFLEVTRTESYTFTDLKGTRCYGCTNHNALLSIMEGAVTGKTGFTAKAGYCYVGAVERDGKLLIVSLLACGWPNHKGYKWLDTKKLIRYGMENYEKYNIIDRSLRPPELRVKNGQQEKAALSVQQEDFWVMLAEGEKVTSRFETEGEITAPVRAGQQVGTLDYYLNGAKICTYPVVIKESVEAINFRYCLTCVKKQFFL